MDRADLKKFSKLKLAYQTVAKTACRINSQTKH